MPALTADSSNTGYTADQSLTGYTADGALMTVEPPIQPTALADDDYLERYLSELGIRSWTNHDTTNDLLASDITENAAVLRDCKIYAGSMLAGRLSPRYTYAILAQSPMMQEIWAVIALRTLCFRRGNPPPASLEFRYQEIVQKDGILDELLKGTMLLTDAFGNPLRVKNASTPSWANLQIDRRWPESQVRVVSGSSDRSSTPLTRRFDKYRENE